MARLAVLAVCAVPLVLAAVPDGSLRGAKSVARKTDLAYRSRQLGGSSDGSYDDDNDDGAGMGPTPTTTTSWDDTTPGDDSSSPADPEEEGRYSHLGCYSDSKADRVLGLPLWSDEMDAKACHVHCNVQGAFYMATQYGRECWCSRRSDLEYRRHGVGVCDTFCSGDENETCGGYNAFDLYELEWAEASTSVEYVDCYADKREDRVMSDSLTQDNMTTDLCRDHCEDKGSRYYATQFGNECWCGSSDDFSAYERHGTGVCHMACAGDDSVACGGYNAFSLFRFDDGDMATPAPVAAVQSTQPVVEPTPAPVDVVEPTPAPVDVVEPTPAPVVVVEPTPAPVDEVEPTPAPVDVVEPTPAPVVAVEPTPAPVEPTPEAPTSSGGEVEPYGETFNGEGTYYGEADITNCAITSPIPSMYSGMIPVAIGGERYGDSLLCGACIEGEGSGIGAGANPITGTFKAYVSDKCPECSPNDLDFSESGDGRWDISWKFVPCPNADDMPSFLFAENDPYYLKVQPRGTATPVKEVTINGISVQRTPDNFFELDTGSLIGRPVSVETTTMFGDTVTQEVGV